MSLSAHLVILGVCLACSAFFAASETALLSLPRARIFKLAETSPTGRLIRRVLIRPDKLLGAILLGQNLFNVAGSVVATALALGLWGSKGLVPTAMGLTILFLFLAEVMPKTLAAFSPERISLTVIRPLSFFMVLFQPVVFILAGVSTGLLKLTGQPTSRRRLFTREDFVTLILSGRREGYLDRHEQEMLRSVIELHHVTVREVMQPLKDIKSLAASMSAAGALAQATGWPYSRYPVYDEDPEKVIGYVHLRDLITAAPGSLLAELAHPPVFVPETRTIQDQLAAFRDEQVHQAFVVDEFGRLMGLVTLEDVMEEIVGEILDEYDTKTAALRSVPGRPGVFSADGRLTIRELNRLAGLTLPEGPYHTLSGLIQAAAQKIPLAGEVYQVGSWRLKVERMEGKAVGRVEISPRAG